MAIRNPDNRSISMVLRELGLCPTSGAHYLSIQSIIKRHALDCDHYLGKTWRKGTSLPLSRLLVLNGPKVSTSKLKQLLIKNGLKDHSCEECGLATWRDRPIPVQLHHQDGNRRNNSLTNLQILCPNCHAQTDTYAVPLRNRKA